MTRSFARHASSVIVVVCAVWAWQQATRHSTSLYMRSPTEIADALAALIIDHRLLTDHVWPSAWRMSRGLLLASGVGIAAGLLLGRVAWLRPWCAPLLNTARAVPPPALIGVLFVSFGPGDGPKVFLVFLGALFPILFNAMDGAASVDPAQLDVADALHLRRRDRIVRIVLPAAAPRILAGLRTSAAIALVVVVTSEVTGSVNGLGRVLVDAQQTFRWQDVWAVLVVLAALGVILSSAVTLLERRLLRWQAVERNKRRA